MSMFPEIIIGTGFMLFGIWVQPIFRTSFWFIFQGKSSLSIVVLTQKTRWRMIPRMNSMIKVMMKLYRYFDRGGILEIMNAPIMVNRTSTIAMLNKRY